MSTKSGHDLDSSHHEKHHSEHGKPHHKHPPLRDAVMKAGRGDGATTYSGGGRHSPTHGRPRASTLTRTHGKYHKGHHEHDRQSVGKQSDGHAGPQEEYENTYKLVPDTRFQESQVKEIIAKVLKENLTEKEYDPRVMSRRCLELSEVIKERVKKLDMKRFKIVCMVIIGQNTEQSMIVSSRCLWNFNYDNFTSFTLKKELYYAIGMVFGSYTE